MSQLELAIRMFLQLTVILLFCRGIGWIGRRFFGQTQVVMEMVAGVLLGPSLFGLLAPQLQAWLFPRQLELVDVGGKIGHPSMIILYALSQVGLVLYMFLIGLEFNADHLRGRVRSAGLISGAGIVVPFVLGGTLGLWMLGRGGLFQGQVGAFSAALYIGSSMAITAFPMLARILYERGLSSTRLGTVTLAAGSSDDAMAWCLLAVVLASQKRQPERGAADHRGRRALRRSHARLGPPVARALLPPTSSAPAGSAPTPTPRCWWW
ncbi:MAG: cation:proton antiporter [Thermoanaerobaculia bacterium]|nr:cation:proton antiporter [Thermoanaerobaculia bacterium]